MMHNEVITRNNGKIWTWQKPVKLYISQCLQSQNSGLYRSSIQNVTISNILILHFQGQDQILNSDSYELIIYQSAIRFKHCTELGVKQLLYSLLL